MSNKKIYCTICNNQITEYNRLKFINLTKEVKVYLKPYKLTGETLTKGVDVCKRCLIENTKEALT